MLITFLALLLVLLPVAPEALSSSHDVVERVQARYNEISNINAKFYQFSVNKASMVKEHSWGTVYISKPAKMRWEYEEPEHRLIVSDGQKVWSYFPEQNQVYVAKLNEAYLTRTPLAFLTGKGSLREEFEITYSPLKDDQKEPSFSLELRPRNPQMNLSRLVLHIDGNSYLIVKSDLYDSMGNLISIKFDQISIDQDMPQSLFQFSPPANVEVVEMGGGG